MPETKNVFGLLILFVVLYTLSKKDPNTCEVRLTAVTYFDGVNLTTTSLQYDQAGRINKVLFKENN